MGIFDKAKEKIQEKAEESALKQISPYLFEGEQILHLVPGSGAIAATNDRVLFLEIDGGVKWNLASIPYEHILFFSIRCGSNVDKLMIHTMSETLSLTVASGKAAAAVGTVTEGVKHFNALVKLLNEKKK